MASSATPVWTIGSLLTWTADFFAKKQVDEPRLSAELLLSHALNCSRMALYTQYERVPEEGPLAVFRGLLKERANHVPVAYLIGKAWFFSLELIVTPDVLIPGADTETIVEFVLQHARQRPGWKGGARTGEGGGGGGGGAGIGAVPNESGPVILDLCTGSGAIAIALAKQLPGAVVTATDISSKAAALARQNVELHKVGSRVTILEGDLYEPLARERAPSLFHVITANPPYIPTGEIPNLPPAIRDHVPRLALDGGADGLALHRRILADARRYLQPDGLLVMEMQFDQAEPLKAAIAAAGAGGTGGGFANTRVIRDAAGHPRCVVTTRE